MAEIRHMVLIDAPVERVYSAITEQEGLAGWWTAQTAARPEVGAVATFTFGDRYHAAMKILSLEVNRKVEWQCIDGDEEWVGTKIAFDLEKQSDQTLLRFFHSGWRQQTDFYASCNYNWGFYMRSLKLYSETGRGEPFEYRA